MRLVRAAPIVIVIAVFAVIVLHSQGAPAYRAAAVFDTAKGMVPGQLVKVAGTRVGTVTAVRLAPGPTALIEFSVARRFAPFHADARCRILPEGPISEYYVECDPGSPARPPLGRSPLSGLPTVPLTRTTVPVALQDLLNIFSLPVSERLGVLVNELGIGTAGRGADLNTLLRRADPALTEGDRVLSILDAQNTQIAGAVTQTRAVIGSLAARNRSVRGFVDHAASVSATLAGHAGALRAGVRGLPALLRELDSGLAPLNRVAVQSTPLLADLRASAPGLTRLTRTLPAFSRPGLPAIRSLGRAAAHGLAALAPARLVADELKRLAPVAATVLRPLDELLVSSRDSGAFEGLLRLAYSLSTDSGAYDALSHYVSALIIPFPTCIADAAARGCSHTYSSPGQGATPINAPPANAPPATAAAAARPRRSRTLNSLLRYLLR